MSQGARSVRLVALFLAMFAWLGSERARAQERVQLTFAPDVPTSLAQRIQSASDGQLADVPASSRCSVQLSRTDSGLTLALSMAMGARAVCAA